jgi:hypothetical protein
MSTHKLTEIQISLLDAHLQSNLPAALTAVDADRGDHNVGTEAPEEYLWFPKAQGYKTPALFILADDTPFEVQEGANFIKQKCRTVLEVVLEEKNRLWLTIKCWRYQAALSTCLVNLELQSPDNKVKLKVKQKSHTFTGMFTNEKNEESDEAAFRKSVVIELEVEHYESF